MRKTSIDAYYGEQPKIENQQELLESFFRRSYEHYPTIGYTDPELQRHFGWSREVVWSRRAKLVQKGRLYPRGTRVNPLTNHHVTVWWWNP